MKLRSLTIHNIMSIADAAIDFDRRPLSEADVFLITGATGSGKSAILDAICLALYNRTPRLDSIATSVRYDSVKGSDMKINDERQLLRNGTGEGFVRLTFTGIDNRDYCAEWGARRARDRASGKIQKLSWVLRCGDDFVLTRYAEIERAVIAAVGLDFAQFCRTTMLAQGQFTMFLKSDDKDKARILEKLTGETIYAEVGRRLHERTMESKRALETLRTRLSSVSFRSEEEMAALAAESERLTSEVGVTSAEADGLRKKREWFVRDRELSVEAERAATALAVAEEVMKSPENVAMEADIREWNVSEPARRRVAERANAIKSLSSLDEDMKAYQREFGRLRGAVAANGEVIASERHKLRSQKSAIEAYGVKTEAFAKSDTITTLLSRLIDTAKSEASTFAAIKKNEKEIDSARSRRDETVVILGREREVLAGAESALDVTRRRMSAYDQKALTERLRVLNDDDKAIIRMRERRKSLEAREVAMALLVKQLSETGDALTRVSEELRTAESALVTATALKEERRNAYEALRDVDNKVAETMRAALTVGCDCPVCRQRVTILPPSNPQLRQLVDNSRRQLKEAEKSFDEAQTSANAKRVSRDSLAAQVENMKHRLDDERAALTRETEAANNDESVLLTRLSQPGLDEAEGYVKRSLAEVNGSLSELSALSALAEKQRVEAEKQRGKAEAADSAVKCIDGEIQRLDGSMTQLVGTLATLRQTAAETSRTLAEISGFGPWTEMEPSEARNAFLAERDAWQKLTDSASRLEISIAEMERRHLEERNAENELLELLPDTPVVPSAHDAALISKLRKVHGGVTSVRESISRCRREIEAATVALSVFYTETGLSAERVATFAEWPAVKIERMRSQIEKIKSDAEKLRGSVSALERQRVAHVSARPAIGDDETEASATEALGEAEKCISDARTRLGAISQIISDEKALRETHAGLLAEIATAEKSYSRLQRLNVLFGSTDGEKFRSIAQSFVLESLLDAANIFLRELDDRYYLQGVPGQYTILLGDAQSGMPPRPVVTASGGESFLVSLALALALSDFGGGGLSVETLFIDEGFGTLSGTPLTNAISLLRSLNVRWGRRVGIISHIEALKNEIPVRIVVSRSSSSSPAEIRVEP